MKNTMKMKSLLSFFVPAAMMSLMVAGCSDYDNGYDSNAIKFNEEFRKAYGDIDPEQDWNLAERGTVTVSTMKESEVKIYAFNGEKYSIVGDYEGVKGTRMLGFDMVEGTQSIMVTDGMTAEKTVPGGVVTFGGTRTVNIGDKGNGINVSLLQTDEKIGQETYPAYRLATSTELKGVFDAVPQSKYNVDNGKVTDDFTFVSTGAFIIYPTYWYTTSGNTLGLYYYDDKGDKKEIDLYTMHNGNNSQLWYSASGSTNSETFNKGEGQGGWNAKSANGWTLDYSDNYEGNFQVNGAAGAEQQESRLKGTFMEFWRSSTVGLQDAVISKTFTDFVPEGEYLVEVKAGLRNQKDSSTDNMGTITFSAGSSFHAGKNNVELTADGICSKDVVNGHGNLYSDMRGTGKMWVNCKADASGNIQVKFELDDVNANWFFFNDLKFTRIDVHEATNEEHMFGNNDEQMFSENSTAFTKGQGIKVVIPPGTVFGMYLKKKDGDTPHQFYSESKLNQQQTDEALHGYNERLHRDSPYCYGATFYVGDQMFLAFEDWAGKVAGGSDFDLNDMVFAFDGCKPEIISERADSWLIVSEDLGGSFDVDYNDIVFKVEHVSGQTTATVTPLAAGGTLASYIFFLDPQNGNNDQCIGEIHQMFGVDAQTSGEYTPINVTNNRAEYVGNPVTINVAENWTMAFYSTDTYGTGTSYSNVNMGGFEIRTLQSGTEAPTGNVTTGNSAFTGASRIQPPNDKGMAPYILCLPYSYTNFNEPDQGKMTTYVWAWPQELVTICSENGNGPYPQFSSWVSDKSKNEWYKNRADGASTVSELSWVNDMPTNNGGNNNNNTTATLGHVKETVYADRGIDLKDLKSALESNLTNKGSGDVTYYYKNYQGNWDVLSQKLWNPGNRRIKAEQGGQSTEFNLYIYGIRYTTTLSDTKYGLAYVDGVLALKNYDATDISQQWVTEDAGDDYFYLKNLGSNKYVYLALVGNDRWSAAFSDSRSDNAQYKFKKEGSYILVQANESQGNSKYMGKDSDRATVYLNKASGSLISWTEE